MNRFNIEYYKDKHGKCPISEFLISLEPKMRAKALKMILLLEEYGNELTEPYSKHLSDGLFELRINQGNNISRILYFFIVNQKIILTNGFIKKTQKTPPAEIKLAKKYKKDYLSRKENS